MEFDIDDIIAYIRSRLSEDAAARYSDDDIMEVVDAIVDYDFDNGLLDLNVDVDDDDDPDIEELVRYVGKRVNRRGISRFSDDDIVTIVKAELEYEDSVFD